MLSTLDLGLVIKKDISENGPMPISKFMSQALNHYTQSYYKNLNPIGTNGDFITAPEISQLFGEIVGIWCANYWHTEKKPNKIKLIELGPGKGTLMSDILRATKHIEGFHNAVEICLVEINTKLKELQKQKIQHKKVSWFEHFDQIPQNCFSIIIANEFFDALPIEQYIKRDEIWHINMVDIEGDPDNLCITKHVVKDNIRDFLTTKYPDAPEGSIVEINDESAILIKSISKSIQKHGGAALVIDYGYIDNPNRNFISTLQSIKDHKFNPIFNEIGNSDITAHVNFSTLVETAAFYGAHTYGPISQGQFLQNMQIEVRKEMILKKTPPSQKDSFISGYNRLINKDQMGELFKVMAFSHKKTKNYIGF